MATLTQYDHLLTTDTVAALTAYQVLEPVEGPNGVIFPPTFAASSQGEKGDYNIDPTGGSYHAVIDYEPPKAAKISTEIRHESGGNVCIIDTVGAEANRIEPLFKPDKCDGVTPRSYRKSVSRSDARSPVRSANGRSTCSTPATAQAMPSSDSPRSANNSSRLSSARRIRQR